jgi:hypothetical protein
MRRGSELPVTDICPRTDTDVLGRTPPSLEGVSCPLSGRAPRKRSAAFLFGNHRPANVCTVAHQPEPAPVLDVRHVRGLATHLSVDGNRSWDFIPLFVHVDLDESAAEPARVLRGPADAPLTRGHRELLRALRATAGPLTDSFPSCWFGLLSGTWVRLCVVTSRRLCCRSSGRSRQQGSKNDQADEAQDRHTKATKSHLCPFGHSASECRPIASILTDRRRANGGGSSSSVSLGQRPRTVPVTRNFPRKKKIRGGARAAGLGNRPRRPIANPCGSDARLRIIEARRNRLPSY